MPGLWYSTTLTIPNGASSSPELDLDIYGKRLIKNILILGPSALTGVVTPRISLISGGTFVILQSGAVDIGVPAQKGTQINGLTVSFFKLVSDASETGARTFTLIISYG